MRICRFNDNRLGLMEVDKEYDVSTVLESLPALKWPVAPGDFLIECQTSLLAAIATSSRTFIRVP
ncbi:hypothetical protein D3871_26965 [Noviherbaspirillum saxi]|uniref:Uncharacterized protein n=1 Tax=Noviherbaspirillum saxi TaxID=2320863 RepID=A0A3A3FL77_9BURK|nr:hypothetical protein D3871_26965 [Noviherbaspirillum saxi]